MSYNHLSSGGGGLVAKLHPTLANPTNCTLPGSSVHGIPLARIVEWVAISFSRGSSWPRDQTQVSCIAGRFFYQLSYEGSPTISVDAKKAFDNIEYKFMIKKKKDLQKLAVEENSLSVIKIFYKDHMAYLMGRYWEHFHWDKKRNKFLVCPFLFIIVFEILASGKIKDMKGRELQTWLHIRKNPKSTNRLIELKVNLATSPYTKSVVFLFITKMKYKSLFNNIKKEKIHHLFGITKPR